MEIEELVKSVRLSPTLRSGIQERRLLLFKRIHEIVFYGKGGYDFETVYNLPIWLRKFVYNEILKSYKSEQASYEKATGKQTLSVNNNAVKPRKQSNYTIKARK